MNDDDNKRRLYDALSKDYDMGTFEQFSTDVEDEGKRRKLYDAIREEYDLPDFDGFTRQLVGERTATPARNSGTPEASPAPVQSGSPYQMASPQTPTYNYGGETQTPRGKKSTAKANAVRAKAAMPRPAQSTMQQQIDETRSRIYEKDPTAIANVTDADRARWEELSRRRAEEQAQQEENQREQTRTEMANLDASIEQQLKDARARAIEAYENSDAVQTLTNKDLPWYKKIGSAVMLSNNPQVQDVGGISNGTVQAAMLETPEVQDLTAAKRKLRDAKRIIAEADHNAQQGTFGDWLERSFMGGAARGFAQRATDLDTWDFGISDLKDNLSLMEALNAADRGEHLTKSQQALLDATVIEMAVNTYFGSEVGRGYKAGSVTAESLPFMLEMMINPAAGIGKSMSAKMTRYALKRFGKAAVKKGGKKYAARKGMEITGRVVGDALVGAPTMAATTGAVRTTADAFERMNNTQMAGEEMSFGEAFGKAFANTTIQNFSEMFGAYFKPLAGATGEGLTRIATSKAGSKIGLNRVYDFIENVGASDVARLVTDFEKHARWNGVFGEYAEEVVGNVINALVVGDQNFKLRDEEGNFSLHEEGSIFNWEDNLDTFLGVSLLGGFMSGVKTAGYRTPKYQARKAMNEADNVCRSAFENEDVNWDAIRATLSTGNVADVKAVLQDIATNPDYTEEQKRAVMDYASKATAYKGILTAEQKRRASGEESDEQIASEEAFDRGYEATDIQARHDIAMELADASLGTMSAEERQAAWDGVRQRIEDEADNNDIQQRMEWQRMQHTSDGSVRPVVLKEKDADGHDKQVYVVDGNVQMFADGTMVDPEASDHSVVIYDPATGERRMIDPTSDMGIMSMGEPVSADEYEYNLQQSRQEYVQRMLDEAQGTVRVELGQQLTMPDGKPGVVMALSPDGESFTVVAEDGSGEVRMERSNLQQVADAASIADYQARHQEQVQAPEAEQVEGEEVVEEQEGLVEGAPAEFIPDMEITLLDDEGNKQPATVLGRVRYEGGQFVPDENGNIVEYMVDGQVKHENTAKLAEKVVSHVDAAAVPEETADVEPVAEAQTAEVEAPSADATGTVAEVDPMPMREDGEADFLATTPERGHQFIYNEAGLSREEAGQFVKANLETATKALDKAKKEAPKMGTSLVKYKQQQAEHQAKVDAAQQAVDYWQGVKATQSAIVSAEMAEQAERDRIAHEAAVLEEAARQAEELAKREEQAALGSNAVAPQIVEKWTASPKVEGVENEITLANGEKVKGHYMLVESGAATPSHNPNMEFARNEGFPIDENGQTVNDRDYERDQEAQRITRQMADSYDSRAIQNVPVVSQEGIVLSGNGRTMAGELAAQQGTDGAYIEHLKKYPQQFGFTPEQVEGMQHPRVVFVADEDMPYTTDTFAKFNQQDMKSQSRTEQSVKMGKTVDDSTFGRIIRSINGFDSLADFYNDPVAATNAIGELHSAGAINTMQLAEMMDGEKVSGNGRQMLENMLIGKAFESNPDAIRQLAEFPAMRQSIVSALAEIANNLHLGEEFSLESELAQAINLAYQARKNGVKAGEKVSWFARQQSLFPFDTGETVADYTNATVLMLADCINDSRVSQLKKVLGVYNQKAESSAAGQYNIFSGVINNKSDILKEVTDLFDYGTEQEQQSALDNAVEQRKQAAAVQQPGGEESVPEGSTVEGSDAGSVAEEVTEPQLTEDHGQTERPETDRRDTGDRLRDAVPGGAQRGDNGVDIGSLAEGLAAEQSGDRGRSQREDEEAVGHQIIENAKKSGVFIDRSTLNSFGERVRKPSGESVVYVDDANNRVVKVKDPYAKDNLKGHAASDALYEHIVHNLLFPNTPYRLIGISDNSIGDVRFVLEQDIIDLTTPAIQQDIDWYLINELGLTKVEKPYLHYENDYYSITDVEASGDNVFIDGDGAICFIDPIIKFKKPAQEVINYLNTGNAIAAAEAEVDTNPTEGQKEAGNYKKGHLKLDGYDITIEQPKGSIRRGTDDNGKQWEQEMHNTYGYIRGTEGVDGDHIDVFLSDDPTSGDVFVVDQVDQMGIFDEHKVMYGFPDIESAKAAYLSNYEEGWQGCGAITPVSKEEFKKWIESSHRKTKPFAEYASVKTNGDTQLGEGSPYARYHREAEAEIQQLLDAAPDRTGPVASPERTEAIQKIADMLNEADSAIEDLELNDDQLQRFQARRDAAEKWLEENVYGEGVALSVEDLKEASDEAAAVQQTEQPAEAEASDTVAEEVVKQPKEEVKKSKWVDDEDVERFEELRRRMRELKGHLNMGVNPEQLAIGVEMSYYVIKHGAHKFADYAKQMIDALGEWVRPYLKSFYNGARDLPEMEAIDNELTPFDEVRSFDVMNFDKEGPKDIIAMADEVVREREADRQSEEATAKLKQQRKERRKKAIVDEGPNLFTGIEDTTTEQPKEEKPLNNNNNETTDVQPRTGEKGRGRHKPQQDGALGEGAGNETARPDGGRVDRRDKAHPGTDGVGSEGVSGEVKSEQVVEQPKRNLNNNHAERGTDYAPKDVDKRIAANIAAIEKMQELMESGKQATPEDMAVLRKFSGWGGLGKAFQEKGYGYGYDPTATSKRLKALLGDEAYEQANMSRNSAYYTPAKVIDALWDIARAMGFKGGKVLEGSAGIGNILGLMPQDMSEKSDIHAVEIDSTTGNILKLLYPDAKVDVQGFEATEIENGSVDLAITNVPFVTGLRVNDTTGDKDLSKKFRDIHDFCIAKNVRKLREGGIGIFITSSGTLDNSAKLREWIVQDGGADVVGAFRLNNETFGGTGATSDIIVIRKRVNGKKSAHAIDVLTTTGERTAEYDTGEMKKVKGEFVDVVKQLSLDYNKYFVEHPEMMGGEMGFAFEHGDDYRATSKGLYPKKGINQEERLAAFVKSMEGMDDEASAESKIERVDYDIADALEEDSRWKGDLVEGRLFIDKEGRICMAQRATAVPLEVNANKVKGHTKQECLNAYTDIRDALDAVLKYQTENDSDEGLQPLLDALNNAYDQFISTYGHLHKNTAISFLKNDVDFANILALDKFSERGDVKTGKRIYEYGKTDIFSQRVVEKEKAPEPTNVKDGIISSIYVHGRVDVPWIASMISQHTGKDITEAQVKEEIISSGLGFENPATRQMEVSYDYLSGNVREKLAQAQQSNSDGRYDANIKALEDVIPMNIPSHLIDFSIGSSWIDPKLYEDYVKEKTDIDVTLTLAGGTWFMKKPGWVNEEKNRSFGIVSQMLNKTIMGTDLIEAAMQNRTITVSETRRRRDGSTETVTDKDATTACANKIDEIRQDFKDWARGKMQSDAAMSEHIERIYNEMFNNYVPKSIPDDFVPEHFGGAATMVDGKPFALRPHQGKAVVRGTTQPLLLAHEVGTGKTYTLITTAMEMRRLGTARKPMIVVQNATVGQFVESAKKLYPNAKVLTIEDKDHTAEGRKNFYAKIKYNDWDMIVVPQSVFERIPDSEERQMAFVSDKIEEKELVLEQMKEADPDGSSMIVRQAEKEIEKLNEEMGVLTGFISEKRKEKDAKKAAITRQNAEVKALEMLDRQTDDVENFDDMGIDALLVDEAHEYKHLGFATAMQRGVKGVDPSYSKKAQGVYLKTQAVMEKNNGRNVVFATGTPISNTAAEIWTFMRYLMPADTMREYGIFYFDDFVRNFGNLTQMLEFTTSGKFKENNRFAGYVNLPELVRIWSGIADTVLTAEAGGVSDKIPDMEGGKAQDIYLPQTKALRSVMKYVKAELERFENMTGKQKKENSHIPLTMYGIAKAAAVDARLVVADAADDPQSKTNEAVRQTLRSLEDTKDYKGTVALFADNYQNSKTGFNLYEDIREKLIAAGVPEEQIVVMKRGMSVKKKLEIFDMVNRGDVRVIMGSTFTLGTGVNIQERLHTLIHLDAPNRPMDYTQRNGRILRQGNLHKEMNKPVRVLRFGVEDSLDVTAYQRLKTKGAIADSIMNGKQMMSNSMENRVLEEEEDVFGDTVAQLSGSEYAMLKNQAEKDVRKYENKKKQWEADQTYCHNEIPRLESRIRQAKIRLEDVKKALEKVEEMAGKHPEATITVDKKKYDSIDAMSDYIKEFNKKIRDAESDMRENPYKDTERKYTLKVNIGGFDFLFTTNMSVETTSKQGTLFSAVHRKMVYSCDALGLEDVPVKQSLLREGLEDIVQNVVTGNDFRERIEITEKSIARNEASLAQVRERDGKPFGFVKELEAAHKHLDEYTELMKKEMEEKEKKYAEMDAEVEEAVDLSEAQEAEEEESDDLYREGEGPVEPSSTYEEGLKAARSVGYSKKQYDAMLERSERNARKRFADMVEKLNLTDRVEIRDTAEGLKGKKANAKGWYDPDTGKIVVILGNHESADDVVKTILHEGVGHHGLRELFGNHFDQFLDNVYEAADEDVRGKIYAIAEKHGYDFRKATEEYLADMAMDTDFEHLDRQEWWMKIKQLFWEMLHKLGMKVKDWSTTISDNELRYLLWRSYMNLTEPGRYRSLVEQAEDTLMQKKLKVGVFEEASQPESSDTEQSQEVLKAAEPVEDAIAKMRKERPDTVFLVEVGDHYEARGEDAKQMSQVLGINPTKSGVVRIAKDDIYKYLLRMVRAGQRVALAGEMTPRAAEDRELFRDGDFSERDRAIARDYYERMVSSSGYQVREAIQDSMRGLHEAMRAILGKSDKEFRIEEVAGYENAYTAENFMGSASKAQQHYYFQMWFKPLLKAVHEIAGSKTAEREALTNYMMAKHGLERNEKFAERDFVAYQQQYPTGGKTLADFRQNDYAGLTALTGEQDVMDAEAVAQQMVADYESQHDTSELWDAVNTATKVTLAKMYRGGLMSKDSYEHTRDMFEYYIPLRGFDETTSDEVYGYLTSRQGPLGRSILKHAEGRRSKADDPIATIAMMADQAIMQANRNEMKQRFLTFVQNHPSDLVSVSKLWLQYDAAADEWVPVFADIDEGDTAADVARKVEAFEQRMEQLAANDPDNYKSGKEAASIPYRVLPGNMNEHQVLVKRAGETFVLTINGNPRAAQALNGLTNPDVKTGGFIGGFMKASSTVNRFLSSAYTTRTPDFVVSNFFRDMLYSNCMAWVKDTPSYALRFHKNFGRFNPVTMRLLFGKWENGKLDDSKPIEYMFKQFMMNGGETGYTNVRDIEAQKRRIVKELRRQGSAPRKVLHVLGEQLDLVNQAVENCARFAAFITSQELGRSLERSIYDAKEVSVNFNKKGSGDKMMGAEGQTKIGNVAAFLSGAGRCLQVFWNAGVQGMTNFGRIGKRHTKKFVPAAATMFTLGVVIPLIAKALAGDGDDDDKNAYYNLPEYVRRSNICFRVGDAWITIPLPIEFRAIYGLGELCTGVITGEEHYSDGELARQMVAQVSQILPLDFMEGQGGLHNLWPSWAKPIVEAHNNKGWTGLPIYRDTPFNQSDPEFTKVYKSADKHIVAASKWLNEITGGDDYKKGWADVVNPAQVEYVLNGYFGGYFKVPNQLIKMTETATGNREFEWRNMMIANRLIKSGDERTAHRKLQNEYFKYKEEYEETKRLKKKYEKAAEEGVVGYAEKVNFLNNSEEYARYLIFDEYRKDINDLYNLQKEETDEEKRKEYEAEYYQVMREMVDAMHEYEKGKGK